MKKKLDFKMHFIYSASCFFLFFMKFSICFTERAITLSISMLQVCVIAQKKALDLLTLGEESHCQLVIVFHWCRYPWRVGGQPLLRPIVCLRQLWINGRHIWVTDIALKACQAWYPQLYENFKRDSKRLNLPFCVIMMK